MFDTTWEDLTRIVGDLSHRQAQNQLKFDFQFKFYLQGSMSIPSGPNLVILSWARDGLSCGQARDRYTQAYIHTYIQTDTRTHMDTQAMTILEGQNWPRVKAVDMGIKHNQSQLSNTSPAVLAFFQQMLHCCKLDRIRSVNKTSGSTVNHYNQRELLIENIFKVCWLPELLTSGDWGHGCNMMYV